MSRLNVHLYRDSFSTPWGFRLQGGKDLNQALTVQRVFSNSPAEGELQRGDVILSINNRDTAQLTHKQAQDLIKHGGGQVQLVVSRSPPGAYIGPLSPPIVTQKPRAPSLQSPECQGNIVRYLTVQMADTSPTTKSEAQNIKPTPSPQYIPPQSKIIQDPRNQQYFEGQRSSHSQSHTTPLPTAPLPPWAAQQLASKKKAKLSKLGGGGLNFGTTYATLPRGSSATHDAWKARASRQTSLDDESKEKDRLAAGPIRKVCHLGNLGGGGFNFGATYESATLPRSNVEHRLSQPVGSSSSASYGFQPTKVTLNKYGGSGPEVGSDFSQKFYGQTPAQRYEPRHEKSAMLNRVQSSLDNITLSPRSPEVHTSSPFYQPYGPVFHSPQQIYTPTGLLLEQQRLQEVQHEGEVITPVWERRKQFQQTPVRSSTVRAPSKKSAQKFSKPPQFGPGIADLGTDYSIPSGKQASTDRRPAQNVSQTSAHQYRPKPAPPSSAPKYSQPPASHGVVHSTPPAWHRQEEDNTGTPAWRSTLKATGVKPWEADDSFQTDQQQVRSVPYHPTPAKSPISHGPFSPTDAPQIGGSDNGPKVVHLQYNSPMGLYSNQNVAETLKGQTQALSGQKPPPPKINESGERDWTQSAVLKFITQEESKKSKHPPPPVSPKPIFSPVQASQAFYQDSGTSQF